MAKPAVELVGVTKRFGDDVIAVNGIDLVVNDGEFFSLLGPSGCGKTTTMTLVNRLEEPTEGAVYYDGTDIQELEKVDLRRNIGYVIQEIGLFDHMTVGENIATVPELRGWDEDRIDSRIDELLELMDLSPATYRDQYPNALSGGQQQRVGVARALAADPDVILMDEPFGALDPITRAELQDEFLEIQERIDTTILFVTHDINEALKMGDKIAVFDVGEIVQYGTPREILEDTANDFVREFIGDNRALKELKITRVEEIMRPATVDRETKAAAVDGGTDAESVSVADVHVSPTDSAEVALSRMIETDTEALRVVDDGDVVGRVTERDVRDYRATTEEGV